MAYFPDLTRFDSGLRLRDSAVAVGWLSGGAPYPTGDALLACCLRPTRLSRGFRRCDLEVDVPEPP